MHDGIANPRRRGKRSRNSRRMRNPKFYVYGRRSIPVVTQSRSRQFSYLSKRIKSVSPQLQNEQVVWLNTSMHTILIFLESTASYCNSFRKITDHDSPVNITSNFSLTVLSHKMPLSLALPPTNKNLFEIILFPILLYWTIILSKLPIIGWPDGEPTKIELCYIT